MPLRVGSISLENILKAFEGSTHSNAFKMGVILTYDEDYNKRKTPWLSVMISEGVVCKENGVKVPYEVFIAQKNHTEFYGFCLNNDLRCFRILTDEDIRILWGRFQQQVHDEIEEAKDV